MKKVILDVDPGVDDAQAIMMTLTQDDVALLAVTCVAGNTSLERSYVNAHRVLHAWGDTQVPVYKGACCSLIGDTYDSGYHHGSDGLGGLPITDEEQCRIDNIVPPKETAAQAIVRLTAEHPGEVTLVALAPMTNIALALHLDPSLPDRLHRLVFMGGAIHAKGNSRLGMTSEFNFGVDPEAAMFVLEKMTCHKMMVPWETCQGHGLDWSVADAIFDMDTDRARFHRAINAQATANRRRSGAGHYFTCDPYALMVALDERAAVETEAHYVTVERDGLVTRGQAVVDWNDTLGRPHNVHIVLKLDMERFRTMFTHMLS